MMHTKASGGVPRTLVGFLCLLMLARLQVSPPVLAAANSPDDLPVWIPASVNRVIDGNSLDALVEGKRTAVGYLGVEAPLRGQPCWQEAADENRTLSGGGVLLEADETYEFDVIGRRLYYAYAADGQSIEATLVRDGLARAVRVDGRHGQELVALQEAARLAGAGCLWNGA